MSGFQLQRLGLIMEPEPGNPLEVEGVRNRDTRRLEDFASRCPPMHRGSQVAPPVLEAMRQEVAGQIPRRHRVRGAGWNG